MKRKRRKTIKRRKKPLWRRRYFNPQKLLAELNITQGQKIIEVGCGNGEFTILASKTVEPTGRVWAVDTHKGALAFLKRKIKRLNIRNIKTYVGRENRVPLADGSCDIVVMVCVLSSVKKRERAVRESARVLKSKGTFAILEWMKKKTRVGPPLEDRLSHSDIELELGKIFEITQTKRMPPYHNLFLARKK